MEIVFWLNVKIDGNTFSRLKNEFENVFRKIKALLLLNQF